MNWMKWSLFLALFLLSSPFVSFAELLLLQAGQGEYELGKYLAILEDPSGKLTFEEITAPEFSRQFVANEASVPNFGFTASAYWVRFDVENFSQETEWLLELSRPWLGEVDFYFPTASGGFEMQQTGIKFPFHQRDFNNRHFVFALPLLSEQPRTFYLRIYTNRTTVIPLKIWSIRQFVEANQAEDRILGAYYGIMGVMLLYNFFLFVSTRSFIYLHYAFFIFSFVFFQMVSNGLAYEYLWPELPEWNDRSWSFMAGFSVFCVVIFSQKFLQTAHYTPFLHKIFYGILGLSVVSMSFALVPVSTFTVQASLLFTIPMVFMAIGTSCVCWKRGYQPARYYLLGWLSLLAGSMLVNLKAFGVLPSVFLTEYGLQIGSVLEVVFLSLGLADRWSIQEKAKLEVQKQIAEQEREYRKLVENLNVGVFRIDYRSGTLVKANPAALQIFGYESFEKPNIRVAEMYCCPEDQHQVVQVLKEEGEYKNKELQMKRKDGSAFWISVTATVARDPNGKIKWVDNIVHDINDRKEAQAKIQRLNATFEKFVPQQFLKHIASEGIDHIHLGKAEAESLSVLFADIRAFTQFSESVSPQEILDFLNTYLAEVNQPIQDYHGFIDKFIGDGIMALFDRPSHPTDSCHAPWP